MAGKVWRRAGLVVLAVALLATAASCNRDSTAQPRQDPTIPTAAPRTTTTDPYAVPGVIDEDYVNRVLEGLDAAFGDITRLVIDTGYAPPQAITWLEEIYLGADLIQLRLDQFQQGASTGFARYRQPTGNRVTNVVSVLHSDASCVYVEVRRDYSQTSLAADVVTQEWVVLVPSALDVSQSQLNKTGWVMIFDGYAPGRVAPPENPCAS